MPTFIPDAAIKLSVFPSPNHGERRGIREPDAIVLHYTGMPTAEEALARLCARGSEVSAHYFVFEDGRVVQSVPEARRAWHAGLSHWAGVADLNSRSIGIEIANPGHEHGYENFPAAQIAAVVALCRDIVRRRRIAPHRVLAHSDIAPGRKQDPGERFPWRALHAAGIGHWVEPAPLGLPGRTLRPGDVDSEVRALQKALADYGYRIEKTGLFNEETENVVRAFQRHFRQARVDGLADPSTVATLGALLSII